MRAHSGVLNRRLLENELPVALNCLDRGVLKRRLREDSIVILTDVRPLVHLVDPMRCVGARES